MARRAAGLVCAAAAMVATQFAVLANAATLIHAGRVIDGVSDRALTERTVVVEGGRIIAIEPGYRAPATR